MPPRNASNPIKLATILRKSDYFSVLVVRHVGLDGNPPGYDCLFRFVWQATTKRLCVFQASRWGAVPLCVMMYLIVSVYPWAQTCCSVTTTVSW
jgi:hypothetical protein